jgi:hypothetical protein
MRRPALRSAQGQPHSAGRGNNDFVNGALSRRAAGSRRFLRYALGHRLRRELARKAPPRTTIRFPCQHGGQIRQDAKAGEFLTTDAARWQPKQHPRLWHDALGVDLLLAAADGELGALYATEQGRCLGVRTEKTSATGKRLD